MQPSTSFHDAGHGWDLFGLRPATLARAVALAGPLYRRWFRVAAHGAEHVPAAGPAILIANHAGALPIDAAMLCVDVVTRTGRIPRVIADRFVPRLPIIGTLLARLGAVVGSRANVRVLLERGELIVIFPEGSAGIGKPYHDRYRFTEWRVGHAELAIRHRAPVIPVGIIGAAESWPVIHRLRRLHPFGAPFVPVPGVPLPLPLRFDLHYGAPIALHTASLGFDPDDPAAVGRAATLVREAVEDLIIDGRSQR